jgi:N-acetylmuramoyl-L-alanine amidase
LAANGHYRIKTVFLLLLLLKCFTGWGQEMVYLRTSSGEDIRLPVQKLEGELYVPVGPLAEKAGLALRWNGIIRRVELEHPEGGRIAAVAGSNHYLVGEQMVFSRFQPLYFDAGLYIPLETLKESLSGALGLQFRPSPTPTPTVTPPAPTSTPPYSVYDRSGPRPTFPALLEADIEVDELPEQPEEEIQWPPRKTSARTVVVIDPAGDSQQARIGPQGQNEAELLFRLAQMLKERLETSLAVEVRLTRKANPARALSAEARAIEANRLEGDLLVSLHLGGGFTEETEGFTVFYMSEVADGFSPLDFSSDGQLEGQWAFESGFHWETAYQPYILHSHRLARLIQQNMARLVRAPDRGVRAGRMTLLRSVQMPSVWVELGVFTSGKDALRISQPGEQEKIVEALFFAVQEYLDARPKDPLRGVLGRAAGVEVAP